MRKEWENAWERDSLERHKASSSHWYTRVTCALSPWTGKSIGKSSETKVGLPFLSLLSYPSSVCVGLRPHASGPCFLPKPLIHFPLSFCPPAFFVFFKVWEEKLRLYIVYRTYITPWDPGPTSEREQGREEGGSREGVGERENEHQNEPASLCTRRPWSGAHPCSTQAKRGKSHSYREGLRPERVCVCTRVRVRACVYLCVCSSQKRMSVWQVPQNHPSWLVMWVCILHINLYYSLSFRVIFCLLMMDQTCFTISYPFYCFLKSERKDTESHWEKDIETQLQLFSVFRIHRYTGWLNRGYFLLKRAGGHSRWFLWNRQSSFIPALFFLF